MNDTDDIPLTFAARDLPGGEQVLWQGRPHWRALARDAFHLPWIGVYFLALALWRIASELHDGATRAAALGSAARLLVPTLLCLGVVVLLAWLTARATSFTLTNRRLLMRFGVALPALINIPLDKIEAVKVRLRPGGTGDVAFTLPDAGRLFYHQLWPYARAGRPFPADPMLRAIPEPDRVGARLTEALRALTGEPAPAPRPAAKPTVPVTGEKPAVAAA
jgi:hypothetical protein